MYRHSGTANEEKTAGAIRVVMAATDPIDSERSRAVCDAAIELAGLHGAELCFLYAVPSVHLAGAGTEGMAQREALRCAAPGLDAFVARADQAGLRARWSAFAGKPEDAIQAGAEESDADLVVVAPPHRWHPGRWLRKLRRSVDAPVLCVPPSWRRGLGLAGARILVPTFRRRGGLRAVSTALRVFAPSGGGRGSRVTLLAPGRNRPEPGRDAPAAPSVRKALDTNEREERLAHLAGDLRQLGIDADAARGHGGDPVDAVRRGARDAEAEVIAIDPRPQRRSGIVERLRRGFLGHLLGRISRPLLVP